MRIGYISANLVARASGYDGKDDWGYHDGLTRKRFDLADCRSWIAQVREFGFEGLSVWTAHCWYHTATLAQAVQLRQVAAEHGLPVYSYAGGFGLTNEQGNWSSDQPANWEKTFDCAAALGAKWLTGGYGGPKNLPLVRELCKRHGMKFAFENHPNEKSGADILQRIEGCEDFMGVGFDTGWAGTNNFSAPEAIRKLGKSRLLEVHLKDVRASGGHSTCALGDGVVGIQECVAALREIGYDGWLSIEHEPFDHDPMPEVKTSMERLRKWLA